MVVQVWHTEEKRARVSAYKSCLLRPTQSMTVPIPVRWRDERPTDHLTLTAHKENGQL